MLLNNQQLELIRKIDCSRCTDHRACDGIRYECPKVNFHTLLVDDVSILKQESNPSKNEGKQPEAGFTKTTRKDFETHLYGNTTRCRHKNKILSFFSSEQEAQSLLLFFFSHDGRYYRAYRNKDLTDAMLERQMMSFLYPDNKSFFYAGWHCRFNRDDLMFYLYTPSEMEQPAGFRTSEMEVASPAQANPLPYRDDHSRYGYTDNNNHKQRTGIQPDDPLPATLIFGKGNSASDCPARSRPLGFEKNLHASLCSGSIFSKNLAEQDTELSKAKN